MLKRNADGTFAGETKKKYDPDDDLRNPLKYYTNTTGIHDDDGKKETYATAQHLVEARGSCTTVIPLSLSLSA